VVLRTPDGEWVRRLALRLGEDGRIIEPATLADAVRKEAAAALALYGEAPGPAPGGVS
jgi:proteasome accessory factor C